MSAGYSLHAKLRFGLGDFFLSLQGEYTSHANSGEAEAGAGDMEITQNIVSFKLGPEYRYKIYGAPFSFYFWINLASNRLSGETKFTDVPAIINGTYSFESSLRYGYGLVIGGIYDINPLTSIDVSLHINMLNLLGQSWDKANPYTQQRIDNYLALNDAKDPYYGVNSTVHIVAENRVISISSLWLPFCLDCDSGLHSVIQSRDFTVAL